MNRKPKPTGATFKTLVALDAQLTRAGVPPLTPWWRAQLKRFYEHPTARTLVARVGRRGTKSHVSAKVALNELLCGDWSVPPGEIHRFVFVSVDKTEAGQRLELLEGFLRALGVKFTSAGDELKLADAPLAFKVCAAQVGAVSGYAAIGAALDEVAKWIDGDAEPADEISTSVAAMTAQHPNARRLIFSSPFSLDDFHARLVERGDTDTQLVCQAPTWIANPSISEARTHEIEENPGKWSREFAAVPGNTESSAFDTAHVLAAFERHADAEPAGECFILCDPSSLRHDDFAIAVASGTTSGGLVLLAVNGVKGGVGHTLVDAIDLIDVLAHRYGCSTVYADQREAPGLEALLRQRGLNHLAPTWTAPSKHAAGALLQRVFTEGRVALPDHATLRNQLLNLRARLRPNETIDYQTSGRDFASLLFVWAHAVAEGHIQIEDLGGSYSLGAFDTPEGAAHATALALAFGGTRDGYQVNLFHDNADLGALHALSAYNEGRRARARPNALTADEQAQLAEIHAEHHAATQARREWKPEP